MPKKRPVFEYKGLSGLKAALSDSSSSSSNDRTHATSEPPRRPRQHHPYRRRKRRRKPHHHHHHRHSHHNHSNRHSTYRDYHRSRAVPPGEYTHLINARYPPRDPRLQPRPHRRRRPYPPHPYAPHGPRYPPHGGPRPAHPRLDPYGRPVDPRYPPGPYAPSAAGVAAAAGAAAVGLGAAGYAAGAASGHGPNDSGPPPSLPKHYPQPPTQTPSPPQSSQPEGMRDRLKHTLGKLAGAESDTGGDDGRKTHRTSDDKNGSKTDDEDENSKKESEEPQPGQKRRGFLKYAALTAGALIFGTVAKRIFERREKKKNQQELQNAPLGAESATVLGADGQPIEGIQNGEILSHVPPGVNPLQMRPPPSGLFVSVPDSESVIVERSGKYHRKLHHGSNVVLPFVDKMAFRHSLREVGIEIPTQQCYSRDNISVRASALMFVRTEDPVAASYAIDNAFQGIFLLAQTSLKKEVGRLTVDESFADRAGLADRVLSTTNEAARPWGLRVTRFDVSDMDIPPELRASIGREAEAERLRRADILYSEGQREALINRADAEMQAQMRLSQARQLDIVNQAIGEAHAIHERGEAVASAMRDVAEAVRQPGGDQAMRMRITEQYIDAYARANSRQHDPNAPPPPDPSHVVHAMNDALGLLTALGDSAQNVGNAYAQPHGAGPYAHDANVHATHQGAADGYYASSQGATPQYSEHHSQSQQYDYASTSAAAPPATHPDGYETQGNTMADGRRHEQYTADNPYAQHDPYGGQGAYEGQDPYSGHAGPYSAPNDAYAEPIDPNRQASRPQGGQSRRRRTNQGIQAARPSGYTPQQSPGLEYDRMGPSQQSTPGIPTMPGLHSPVTRR